MKKEQKLYFSHGDGKIKRDKIKKVGKNVIFEKGVLIFHPENIEIGNNVYIGHYTILHSYYKSLMKIGNNVWIGPHSFFHSAGGLIIKDNVGIGPKVIIITSQHNLSFLDIPIIEAPVEFAPVEIEENSDIGAGSIILPGVKIGKGVVIGAGAVVTKNIPPFEIWAGVPAKKIKERK
ncbi:MAG TPA: acyltransferase [bacterium]|nr:acyltransferase [bacterium]